MPGFRFVKGQREVTKCENVHTPFAISIEIEGLFFFFWQQTEKNMP